MGGMLGNSTLSFYGIRGEMRSGSKSSTNAWATLTWDSKFGAPGVDLTDMSLFSTSPGMRERISIQELVDRIWNRIVDLLEGTQ